MISYKTSSRKKRTSSRKKRIPRKKYIKKYKSIKRKMIGGTIDELKTADATKKTIVLMGEFHTYKCDHSAFMNIIKKQTELIDITIVRFGKENTVFFSESPKSHIDKVDEIHSTAVAQYARMRELPIVLSRNSELVEFVKGNPHVNCVIVPIGILEIIKIKKQIMEALPDIKVIIVNTVSKETLDQVIPPEIRYLYPEDSLLTVEKPYTLPGEFHFHGNPEFLL